MKILKDSLKDLQFNDKNSIVLDIETSGVSRINSRVIVASFLDENGQFTQLIANDPEEEIDLLDYLYSYINNKKIITYNGENFDIPFLKSRYIFHKLDPFEEKEQFDLYRYFIKNRLILDNNLFSLKDIENHYSIDRFENFEQDYDIEFYSDFIKNHIGNESNFYLLEDLLLVLLHNKYDVINTRKLLNVVDYIEKEKIIDLENFNNKNRLSFESSKIEDLYIDKDFLKIRLKLKDNINDFFYLNNIYKLEITGEYAHLDISIRHGYLSPDQIGYVHIAEQINEDFSNKKYNLPANIIYIFDERFNLDNIKLIIKMAFNSFFN